MKIKKSMPIIMTAVLLIVMIIISSVNRKPPEHKPAMADSSSTVSQAMKYSADETMDDMRGVWITYMELSMENEEDKSEAAFKRKFTKIAADCKSFGVNTLIVQVRPFCDALYQSELFPASHILSGTQGEYAGYDALKLMCEICRENGLKIHAWINPYRVRVNNVPEKLSEKNPYILDNSLGIETESGIILDPSSAEARRLIIDGVTEIVNNYDVDGIQFDDYFYPLDIDNADSEQYNEYLNNAPENGVMSVETWRSFNVSILISETYIAIHKNNPNIAFGISPQGNLGNNQKLNADVVSWCCKRGFVDYICPQIYFSLKNPALTFENALAEWDELEFAKNVRMFVGLAGYKAGSEEADGGTWAERDDILASEVDILKNDEKVSGFILYSYQSLLDGDSQSELDNMKKALM